jgi:hypothetical protein
MTRKKLRLKKEPVKPLLKNYRGRSHTDTVGESWDHIDPYGLVERLEEAKKIDPKAHIELDLDYGGCYYEGDTPSAKLVLKWTGHAKDEFDKAMVRYKENLAKYAAWYVENKDAIVAELKLREAEAVESALKRADTLERKAKALRKKVS